jgi:hypothetical protein
VYELGTTRRKAKFATVNRPPGHARANMAKGQQAPKTNNKPKLSIKEKQKKKEAKKAAK